MDGSGIPRPDRRSHRAPSTDARGPSRLGAECSARRAGPSPCTSTSSGCPCRSPACSIPWWALALAFAVTEIAVVHVHFRRSSHALTLGELPLVRRPAVLRARRGHASPGWPARRSCSCSPRAASRSASSSTSPSWRVTAGIAPRVFHAVAGEQPALGPQLWARRHRRRAAGGRSSRSLLVNAAMWLSGDRIEPRKLGLDRRDVHLRRGHQHEPRARARRPWSQTDPRAVVLLLAPVLAVFLAYRAHLAERRQPPTSQFLHEASRTLVERLRRRGRRRRACSTIALDNFRGEVAEVCLFAARRRGRGARISVGGPRGLEVMAPLDDARGARAAPSSWTATPPRGS